MADFHRDGGAGRGSVLRIATAALLLLGPAAASRAQAIKVGSFAKTTGGAPVAQVVPHGLGQTPKALILWTDGSTGEDAFGNGFLYAFGMSDGTTSSSVATASQNGVANNTANRARRRVASQALSIVSWTAVVPGGPALAEASLQSWDAANFTLNWTVNDANAYVIHFIAIAGPGVSAKVVNWTMAAALGNRPVTGVGFKPDVYASALAKR